MRQLQDQTFITANVVKGDEGQEQGQTAAPIAAKDPPGEDLKEVKIEEEGVTSSPNAVTISKNTRYAALSTVGYDITAGYDLHVNTDVTL